MKIDLPTPAEYEELAVIAREASVNMLARLDLVALKPRYILNLSSKTGYCTQPLNERYPEATIISLDCDEIMLRYAQAKSTPGYLMVADELRLPIKSHQIDLIVANLVLPWCDNRNILIQEWRRILRPDGLLMFTSLGPDTLLELQQVNVLPQLIDMHHIGDELVQAGFADPVLDVEHVTLKYREWKQLLHELFVTKMMDTGKLNDEYKTLSITYEIIYGHTWAPSAYKADESGIVKIPLEHLRRR